MRRAWAPFMFSEDAPRRVESLRDSELDPAAKSESAEREADTNEDCGRDGGSQLRGFDKADGRACARLFGTRKSLDFNVWILYIIVVRVMECVF